MNEKMNIYVQMYKKNFYDIYTRNIFKMMME